MIKKILVIFICLIFIVCNGNQKNLKLTVDSNPKDQKKDIQNFKSKTIELQSHSKKNIINRMYVKVNSLRIRETPDLKGKILDSLQKGDYIEILKYSENETTVNDITSNWAEIEYNGLKGYVFGGYLNEEPPELISLEEKEKIEKKNQKALEIYEKEFNSGKFSNTDAPHPDDLREFPFRFCPVEGYKWIKWEEFTMGCTEIKKEYMKKNNLTAKQYGDKYCIGYFEYEGYCK